MATRKQPTPKPENLKLTNEEPSLLFAIQELIKTGGVDWDEWWDEWKRGIPNRNQMVTNFRVKDWVVPKYLELTQLDSKSGVRHIEYFPDRENESESFILSGTTQDLIFHIIAIGYQKSSNSETAIGGKNSKPPLAGFPAIKLTFSQSPDKLTKNQLYPILGTKIIRCVGFTDDDNVVKFGSAEKIKENDIKRWAIAIAKIFANYRWSKGKGCLSYSGLSARLQGLEGYAYCKTQADGIELFTALLQIFDKKPDNLCFFWSENTRSTEKYSTAKKEITVLGKQYKSESLRPVVDVIFDNAVLVLPSLSKPIPLVKRNVVIYK